MDLQFLGATGTVTGSKTLLRHDGAAVLVDCGLFQGYKQLRLRNWAPLPVAAVDIDAVVLTHAHIDHSGYLPLLVRQGFAGKVYCTQATAELCAILLPDSGHLQEEEAAYANAHGFSKHQPALPLYTREDAQRCLERLVAMPFGAHWPVAGGLQASFAPSGHMLGSAFVQVEDGRRSVLFSGDIGRPDDLLLKPRSRMAGADYLVCESTYGDRLHERGDVLVKLADVIQRTAARGGAVIIPAFAVGRAQTLLWCIHLLKQRHSIDDLPVYLNSPMAVDATAVYRRHHPQHRLSLEDCEAMCRGATVVNTPDESRALNTRSGPMIIVAASGMATGGRVVHHLKAFAPDWRNTILFTSFQAGGTRGAAMVAGAPTIRIHGEDVPVRAEVAMIENLSAHADAGEIVDWLRGFERPPRQTFITHGEPPAADALRLRIEHELGWHCRMPDYLETVHLE
ncbi:MAG TPA: MBL fold metallo-hydrolase [Albitalea sp.]|nr:MBL fold metallo-hydrolase [Albitalea sp.]